jgi:hypothetical protein
MRLEPPEVLWAAARVGGGCTWIVRSCQDVAEMAREDLDVYPAPSDDKCPPCPYLDPCLALRTGRDDEPMLRTGYRQRAPESPEEGRLGGRAWGMGRGAAPPKFPGRRDGAHGGS